MRPRHLIFATGVSAIPIMPDLPGMDDFAGTAMHSGAYTEGRAWAGKRALVIGTGNSAHDVAQDLHACGADVTMVQRASTHIVSLAEAQRVYMLYQRRPADPRLRSAGRRDAVSGAEKSLPGGDADQ